MYVLRYTIVIYYMIMIFSYLHLHNVVLILVPCSSYCDLFPKINFAVGFTNYFRKGNFALGIAVSCIWGRLIFSLEISLSLFSFILKNSIFCKHTAENKKWINRSTSNPLARTCNWINELIYVGQL